MMRDALRVLQVFLASPGDLVPERQISREVVDEVNDSIKPLRLHIDLLGWEDTRPGVGRPQAIINKDVDACDLFVGLMWRHWGSPTGEHSSGFEEEFERARQRRSLGGSPEMWLSFKQVGDEHLQDPGPHLRRVLDFRQQQVERREVLFKEFSDSAEWRTLFRKWLLTFALEFASRDVTSDNSPAQPVASTNPVGATTEIGTIGTTVVAAPFQLQQVAEFIRSTDAEASTLMWPESDSTIIVAHLVIIASAAMSSAYPDRHLGIREANLAYAVRHDLKLTTFERQHLLRSMIADSYERVPGWYWSQFADAATLLFMLAADRDEAVVTRALLLLRQSELQLNTEYARSVLQEQLQSESSSVREAVIDFLAATSSPSLLDGVDDGQGGVLLNEAKVAARMRCGDEGALDALDEFEVLSERLKGAFNEFVKSPSPTGLVRCALSKHQFLRVASSETLVRFGWMTDALAFRLIQDESAAVRATAFGALITAGAEVDLEELRKAIENIPADDRRALLIAYYRRLPYETLIASLEYAGGDGREIYEALGLEYAKRFLPRVRRDLSDEMASFREEWIQSLTTNLGAERVQPVLQLWQERDLLVFISNQHLAAALRIIAARGNVGDVEFGRRYISNSDGGVAEAAADVLARFGKSVDAMALVQIAQATYGAASGRAGAGAAKLSRNVERVLLPLLRSGQPVLIRPALAALRRIPRGKALTVLRTLLRANKSATRILAAVALIDLDRDRAESVLDEYQKGYRFYDVVCCFDRLLFAPAAIQAAYRKQLVDSDRTW
jgi:preprotein translocase subunit SecE